MYCHLHSCNLQVPTTTGMPQLHNYSATHFSVDARESVVQLTSSFATPLLSIMKAHCAARAHPQLKLPHPQE